MPYDILDFDIAAFAIYAIVLVSVSVRKLRTGRTMQLFVLVVMLLTVTCAFQVAEELLPLVVGAAAQTTGDASVASGAPLWIRSGLSLGYYATRLLAAPAYLVFIVNITNSRHRIIGNPTYRWLLAAPVWISLAIVCSNPLTHWIYTYDETGSMRQPGVAII